MSEKTVLIVEDNPFNMKLAKDLLEPRGINVITAEDGERALALLEHEHPNLILLDIRLPGIDGVEVLKRIRDNARLASVKVVALTASVIKEREQEIRDEGFDDLIEKPIDTRKFIEKIKEILK